MSRSEFPLLNKTIFLDSGAGSLKPLGMIEKISEFYRDFPINTHSMDSRLGIKVYKEIESTRELVADLIDGIPSEVIFTSGTTDGLNKTALMFEDFIKSGDKIILSKYNHSSNCVPWIKVAQRTGAEIIFSDNLIDDIDERTKVVAYAQMNNTLQQDIDIDALYDKVKENGAVLVNDAAQAITYDKVSLTNSDVIVFSGNKIYGPTGIGVLAIKKELLSLLKPAISGGGSISKYDETTIIDKTTVKRFEPGTQNTAGIIGLKEGILHFKKNDNINDKVKLAKYAHESLSKLENIELLSRPADSIVIFRVKGVPSQDVVSYLGHKDIILRSGRHCALYLFDNLGISDSIRMSFGYYNNNEDIDKTIEEIKNGGDFLEGL